MFFISPIFVTSVMLYKNIQNRQTETIETIQLWYRWAHIYKSPLHSFRTDFCGGTRGDWSDEDIAIQIEHVEWMA